MPEEITWEQQMFQLVETIERDIDEFFNIYTREPECIIASINTIEDIMKYLIEPDMLKTINWKNPDGVGIEIRGVALRIFRTMDLSYGKFYLR